MTRYQCPFCGEIITESSLEWVLPLSPLAAEYERVEQALTEHLVLWHPVRWRLNGAVRRAVRRRRVTLAARG